MNPAPNPLLSQSRTPGKIRPTARAWWRLYFHDHPKHEVNRQQAYTTGKPKVYCIACFSLHLSQLVTKDADAREHVRSLDALTAHCAFELMVDGAASLILL